MSHNIALLVPLIALVMWTGVIWFLMLATRVPAIIKSRLRLDPAIPQAQQMALLPPNVRWKADNYNHLMEQPTLFYAVALSLALLNDNSPVSLWLAWAYVGLRVVHSLVQITGNRIQIRFYVFVVSSLLLFALAGRAAMQVF